MFAYKVGVHDFDFGPEGAAVTDKGYLVAGCQAEGGIALVVGSAISELRGRQAVNIDGTRIVHKVKVAVGRIDRAADRAGKAVLLGLGLRSGKEFLDGGGNDSVLVIVTIIGAAAPVVLTSRADSPRAKLLSIAGAVMLAHHQGE